MLDFLFGCAPREPRLPEPDALAAAIFRVRARMERKPVMRLDTTRVLFMANLLHIERHGVPMFNEAFEATVYGPIIPRMMDELGRYVPKSRTFHPASLSAEQTALLDEVCDHYRTVSSGSLVATVQMPGGAWSKRYQTGYETGRGPRITEADLLEDIAMRLGTPVDGSDAGDRP